MVVTCRAGQQYAGNYEAYVASNVQYQASTDPEYQALLSQRQQLQDPDAEAAMVSPPRHSQSCQTVDFAALAHLHLSTPDLLLMLLPSL